MAAPMRQAVVKLSLCSYLQSTGCLLNPARLTPSSLVMPVRTKKRGYTPPKSINDFSTPEEAMKYARAAGIVMPHEDNFRPINIFCTAGIADAYVPPEGDARMSSLSKDGLKQKTERLRQLASTQLSIRKIRKLDPKFNVKTFAEEAQNIFIEAHNNLTNFDKDKLHDLVTEHCYPEMVRGNKYKTIRWRFLESLEPPRIVQVRLSTMVSQENMYGQVTVRMHTRQTLAIYDRFGRLMYGGENIPKDVLEYVVFEKHLTNRYGQWRLHDKIVPSWAPPKDPVIKTVMVPGPKLDPSQEYEDPIAPQQAPNPVTQ
uniref:Large ribosomal subunit protein mL45 n=1 Tax=Pogona vitticeps TaxID=103695 RepID=A0A6J0SY13_9SAUR